MPDDTTTARSDCRGLSTGAWRIGGRYLNSKNKQPLTLRYIGPLPPASSSTTQWFGVEYDNPAHGRGHSGTFEGQQIFKSVQDGAAAFIRVRKGDELERGPTLLQAIRERYGLDSDGSTPTTNMSTKADKSGVILGGSGSAIIVEAPGMKEVQERLKNLDRLRQIGLEDQWISEVGGDADERAKFRQRLRGVELLDISRNLLQSWNEVTDIVELLPGLKILIINDSRLSPLECERETDQYAPLSQLKELHLARSLLDWDTISSLGQVLAPLEELHVNGNLNFGSINHGRPLSGFEDLKVLNLEGCDLKSWSSLETALCLLPALETLDMSGNPVSIEINHPTASETETKLHSLRTLMLLSTPIVLVSDLANLASRIPEIQTLRYSIDPNVPLETQSEDPRLTGNVSDDRVVLLAIFQRLRMLNRTEVRTKERDEAERRYLQIMSALASSGSQGVEWTIYDQLAKKHGQSSRTTQKAIPTEVQPHTLRSKLITLHIYLIDGSSYTMTILPSASISLLRRKIAKKIARDPDDVSPYTVRRTQSSIGPQGDEQEVWVNEKVAKVDEGEVGYWFDDGDGVMVT